MAVFAEKHCQKKFIRNINVQGLYYRMNSLQMTVFGFSIIFIATSLGASAPFFIKAKATQKFTAISLGFSSGIMLAASIWSLILPAIDQSAYLGRLSLLPPVIGILWGGVFMSVLGKFVPSADRLENADLSKPIKLFIAVTVHNIPEGLAVGFAFGAAGALGSQSHYTTALLFAIGIAVQNLPEGAAVSLPFYSAVKSRKKAFFLGVLSGAVEPLFAVIGYFLSASVEFIQPWLLSFSAGAMIFVVLEDLLPDVKNGFRKLASWSAIVGFVIMMALDVALG